MRIYDNPHHDGLLILQELWLGPPSVIALGVFASAVQRSVKFKSLLFRESLI